MTRWTRFCRVVWVAVVPAAVVAFTLAVAACEEKEECPVPNTDISVCDPVNGPFSLDIDNEYFPLPVGHHLVLEGDDEGTTLRVEVTVLDATEVVAGVVTRVMEEAEYEDDELIEVSHNFFAQAPDGAVCYFGEDVDIYENGQVVSHDGAWRAGQSGNLPGIFMPADPQPGMIFYQEYAPGVAEDMSEIVALGQTIVVPAGTFDEAMRTVDCNPLDGDSDVKYYVRNVGIVVDGPAELISY